MDLHDLAARLEALGHPTRLAVYRVLVRAGDRGLPVGRLQERLAIAPSTLSHHLQRLMAVGLMTQERRGTVLQCRADFAVMQAIVATLAAECCADAEVPPGTSP